MTLPELDTRSVLRALDPDADVLVGATPPWREWVAGLPERRALGYAATVATEFRSTPELKPDFTGNHLLTRHLLWIRNRLEAWFQENQQAWLTYLAACATVSADDGGPWHWTTAHQRAWNDGQPVPCPPPVKAMTLFGSSLDELVRSVLVPAARRLFTDLASMSPSSRQVRKVVALVQFLAGKLGRSEREILLDAWGAFADVRVKLELEPGDPERAIECLRELKACIPEELWLQNQVCLQMLHRALQMWPVSRRQSEPERVNDWNSGPSFEDAFINNWD